jgi:hypothetical protein
MHKLLLQKIKKEQNLSILILEKKIKICNLKLKKQQKLKKKIIIKKLKIIIIIL